MNRGGGWNNNGQNLRSANRNNDDPSNRNKNLGFRLARPQPARKRMPPREPIALRRRAVIGRRETRAPADCQ